MTLVLDVKLHAQIGGSNCRGREACRCKAREDGHSRQANAYQSLNSIKAFAEIETSSFLYRLLLLLFVCFWNLKKQNLTSRIRINSVLKSGKFDSQEIRQVCDKEVAWIIVCDSYRFSTVESENIYIFFLRTTSHMLTLPCGAVAWRGVRINQIKRAQN